ncbi:insulinase family protein [Candidatus Kaiserbacteria bacterium]|nr:insulinase family protein [Candidatus Kaiserbacteria bacterium]
MSKKLSANNKKKPPVPGFEFIKEAGGIEEYRLINNGLRVLYFHRPETGVITTNITYLVGARDEARGETGVAHMLEHMLFKPTTYDLKRTDKTAAAMKFERETGCALNANTWKDRTTYYFSYPKSYFKQALKIEAERMTGVVLTDKELKPEQGNVLSEFDMYNGNPHFALEVQMISTAYHSHPYGHETIGYREDIEDYTAAKLEAFYRDYYRPDNAVMMVIGDIDRTQTLSEIKQAFSKIKCPQTPIPRFKIREPKQEGLRRISITRPSTTNIVSIGFKQAGFPSVSWFTAYLMLDILTGGPESILHKLLIDAGKASSISTSLEPTSEENLANISVTLAPGENHETIEGIILEAINNLKSSILSSLLKKSKAQLITEELFAREHSLKIAQELTEYTAAGTWETYTKTTSILDKITTKDVLNHAAKSFSNNNLTIGYFIGQS